MKDIFNFIMLNSNWLLLIWFCLAILLIVYLTYYYTKIYQPSGKETDTDNNQLINEVFSCKVEDDVQLPQILEYLDDFSVDIFYVGISIIFIITEGYLIHTKFDDNFIGYLILAIISLVIMYLIIIIIGELITHVKFVMDFSKQNYNNLKNKIKLIITFGLFKHLISSLSLSLVSVGALYYFDLLNWFSILLVTIILPFILVNFILSRHTLIGDKILQLILNALVSK